MRRVHINAGKELNFIVQKLLASKQTKAQKLFVNKGVAQFVC